MIHCNGLKKAAILPLLVNLTSEYLLRKVQTKLEELILSGIYHLLVYDDDVNLKVKRKMQ